MKYLFLSMLVGALVMWWLNDHGEARVDTGAVHASVER